MSYVCVSFRTYCTSRNHMCERYQMQWLCHFVILIQTISRRPSDLLRAFLLSTRIRNVVIVYDGSKLDSGGAKSAVYAVGQLSLASLRDRLIEYQLRLG